jgi:hypothetical protein
MCASKALFVPWVALVSHTTATNYFAALCTTLSIFSLVARNTNDLVVTRDEALRANWLLAFGAQKAFLVPLLSTILVFPHSSFEHTMAPITSSGETFIITV